METILERIQTASARFPKPDGLKYSYGTAGIRSREEILDCAMFRIGCVAAVRAFRATTETRGSVVGVMITASHNLVHDNGAKIADTDGGMLQPSWEKIVGEIANSPNDSFACALIDVATKTGTNLTSTLSTESPTVPPRGEPVVFVAKDTRPSSDRLAAAVIAGVRAVGAHVFDLGVLSTPQLHWMVRWANLNPARLPTEQDYYQELSTAFRALISATGVSPRSGLIIDAADGVGGEKLLVVAKYLPELGIKVLNDGLSGTDKLNVEAGAEFVQKERKIPRGITPDHSETAPRFASVDGDADRLVYFYFDEQNNLRLLDGDKISSLSALLIQHFTSTLSAELAAHSLTSCVVQTAYANGSSTKYLREGLGMHVPIVATGVKYLHHEAMHYDIGVYFEANGHGTVIFSSKAVTAFSQIHSDLIKSGGDSAKIRAAEALVNLAKLINQAVGDAISDILLVEVGLAILGWDLQKWDSLYQDLPSRQTKVTVKDRTQIKTTPDETRAIAPEGLQDKINEIVPKFPSGRAFVRPSGTEDIVRVYAESTTQELADELAHQIALLVYRDVHGVGAAPTNSF